MATDASEPVRVEVAAAFHRDVRALLKKYRHIDSDIRPVIEQLQAGELPGDQIPGTGHTVFKVRVKNSDTRKGKSSGYRLIYTLRTPIRVVLLTVYSKLEQADIAAAEIRQIIKEFEEAANGSAED